MAHPSNRPATHYAVLGVEADVEASELKKRFRKLARECHPDVAGDDPNAAARFARIREAYEVLSDPQMRQAYDSSLRPRVRHRYGPGADWRPPGGHTFGGGGSKGTSGQASHSDLDLEDLFGPGVTGAHGSDFGFGDVMGGGEGTGGGAGADNSGSVPRGDTPGDDVHLDVDVPSGVEERGGTVMVEYPRLMRAGQVLEVKEGIHGLRIPPGVQQGEVLRVPGWGHQSMDGGPAGALLVRLQLGGASTGGSDRRASAGRSEGVEVRPLPLSIAEAVLGGRVEVVTDAGPVVLTIPPGTSSGRRLRLEGRGEHGRDLHLEVQIEVPHPVDDESAELIREFAERNPQSPRDS